MNICLLTRSHQIGDPRLHSRIGLSLVKGGHNVTIICRIPYGNIENKERYDDIKYIGISRPKIPKMDFKNLLITLKRAYYENADIYVCFELRTLFIGLLLKLLHRSKIVYDCHEYRPETYSAYAPTFLQKPIATFILKIEQFLSSFANSIWCVNYHLAKRFRYSIIDVRVLPNYPSIEFLNGQNSAQNVNTSKYRGRQVLIYAGGISYARGISACLYMMTHLIQLAPKATFIFIGKIRSQYRKVIDRIIKENNLSNNVEFLGRIEHKYIQNYLKCADLGVFLVLPINKRYFWGEPIKYFEYCAAGLPVVISDLPAKRRLIEKFGNGILVDPLDYKKTALQINDLIQNLPLRIKMSKRGYNAFISELNWESIQTKMLTSVDNL